MPPRIIGSEWRARNGDRLAALGCTTGFPSALMGALREELLVVAGAFQHGDFESRCEFLRLLTDLIELARECFDLLRGKVRHERNGTRN